jgi:hypothetical protein
MYVEEQQCKAEEKKRLAQEAELKRRRETPATCEHYQARCEKADICAREADAGGTTSETWPPLRSSLGNFPFFIFLKSYNSLYLLFESSYECICYILLIVVCIDDLDLDSIDGYEKIIPELHLKD